MASVARAPAVAPAPILEAVLPGGASWSGVCRRGTALTLTDLEGGANVSALLYRASDPLERYCMPDTLKAQHVSRLTAGVALYSDMGRVLASVVEDTCGWHDTITGHATAAIVASRWGALSYHDGRNEWRRSAREGLLVELAKHGLGRRDIVANANFFSKVGVGTDGELGFVSGHSPAGSRVSVRFELDTLVVLSSAPHPLDPAPAWAARPVGLRIAGVPPAAADDRVRMACPENERGFLASEAELG
jgi:urea carboxylase-associated protein 2